MKIKIILSILIILIFSGCSNLAVNPSNTDDKGNIIEGPEYLIRVGLDQEEGVTGIDKFGSASLTTAYSIITLSGEYMTPTVPVNLEFVSDDAGDNVNGAGAREITIQGINSSWHEQTVKINTNGLTPVQLPNTWLRVYRWWVSQSGTYAAPNTVSYLGNLEIRETGAGATWTQIFNTPITTGQSQIGAYTVPKGKTAYLIDKHIFVEATRPANLFFFFRDKADDITAPFNGTRRIIERETGVSGSVNTDFKIPKGPFVGPADLGFFGAVTAGTGTASVEFELLIMDS